MWDHAVVRIAGCGLAFEAGFALLAWWLGWI